MDNTIYYSIIIPHRNNPSLLRRLLRSIPKLNYVEIIVVDDNSSYEFESQLSAIQHEYVEVNFIFLKECKGGGAARNVGLQCTKGKWVLFADADDYFNYCIFDILEEYKDSNADIIYFNAISVDSYWYTISERTVLLNRFIKEYQRNQNELNLRFKFGEPWCKLVKRNIIIDNNIKFEETSIHNDTAFSYQVGYYATNMKVDGRALYCLTDSTCSVSKGSTLEKKIERIGVFARASVFFSTHNINVREIRHYDQLFDLRIENKDAFQQSCKMLHQYGFSEREIIRGMINVFVRRLFVVYPKKIVKFCLLKVFPEKISFR